MKQDAATKGSLSKEDAARICIEALSVIPPTGLIFEVHNNVLCFQYKEALLLMRLFVLSGF